MPRVATATLLRRACATAALCTAFLAGGPASAQFYYGWSQPYYAPSYAPPPMSLLRPGEIAGMVGDEGYHVLSRPRLNGRVYTVDVEDRRGRAFRLVVDAFTGDVIQRHYAAIPRPPGGLREVPSAMLPSDEYDGFERGPRIIPAPEAPRAQPERPRAQPKPAPKQKPATAAIEKKPLEPPLPNPAQTSPTPAPSPPAASAPPPAQAPTPPSAALPEPARAAPPPVRPAESRPVEAKPVEPKPAETKPVDAKPDTRPVRPAEARSGPAQPSGTDVGTGTKTEPRVVGVPIAPLDEVKPQPGKPATPAVPVSPLD